MIHEYEICEGDKVVVFGASIGGKLITQCLNRNKVEVLFLCDNTTDKKEFEGLDVFLPDKLREQQYKIIVAVNRSFRSVYKCLQDIGYDEVYVASKLLSQYSIDDFVIDSASIVSAQEFLTTYPINVSNRNSFNGRLSSLEVFITEKCTLRCMDCLHLIPHYKSPKDYDVDEIINYLFNVCMVVDYIEEIFILGGEPLLYKKLDKLLRWCYQCEKIGKIIIITNGCVLPSENILNAIKHTKPTMRISDYGKHSYKLQEIVSVLVQNEIEYHVQNDPWIRMGDLYNRQYSQEELADITVSCPFAMDLILLGGRLWRCVHIAHINNLGLYKSHEQDSIDFSCVVDVQKKKAELEALLMKDSLIGCNFCDGYNLSKKVTPAIQLS